MFHSVSRGKRQSYTQCALLYRFSQHQHDERAVFATVSAYSRVYWRQKASCIFYLYRSLFYTSNTSLVFVGRRFFVLFEEKKNNLSCKTIHTISSSSSPSMQRGVWKTWRWKNHFIWTNMHVVLYKTFLALSLFSKISQLRNSSIDKARLKSKTKVKLFFSWGVKTEAIDGRERSS
jgi:hypothetical protein